MSKPLWKILFAIIGSLALWKTVVATIDLWGYVRLGPEVSAKVISWELIPKGSKYALAAAFTYSFGGKEFTAKTTFAKPYYLNKESAERQIQKMSGMSWTGWVDYDHPQYASLEKIFPMRKIVYALCLIGICLYFIYMRFHLELLDKVT